VTCRFFFPFLSQTFIRTDCPETIVRRVHERRYALARRAGERETFRRARRVSFMKPFLRKIGLDERVALLASDRRQRTSGNARRPFPRIKSYESRYVRIVRIDPSHLAFFRSEAIFFSLSLSLFLSLFTLSRTFRTSRARDVATFALPAYYRHARGPD